ncbi:M3 family oligoendopeptidase [Candidatus Liberibacter americanus]|uniref:Oligoendopeptidase F n=1 Tax=Candidatus Liberibacter americanus str. Sao Paulo TaxID=1261131 RepID=U6B5B4_9HYPH|nr:M3 family oligoendopeptidase [Candidatus Liberibacter americanus]AHA27803.1 Oligoendopeptidase F [Candidatus Liberibacter americanus str. Sao Paulo]EMS36186.1 oligoendopeptidase F [Candidatus Liberibacter americanus PW_SP]
MIDFRRQYIAYNLFLNPKLSIDNKNDCKKKLGELPRWNLNDLYPSHDSQEILNDIKRIDQESLAFKTRWENNLLNATNLNECNGLGAAIAEYERLYDIIGRVISYAYLLHSCNMSNPEISKFYTDTIAKLSLVNNQLIFFALEINNIDDNNLEKSYSNDSLALKYSPWIKNVRKLKKHLLSNDLECLMSDMSQTGLNPIKMFFSETIESLRFKVDDQKLPLEKALNLLLSPDRSIREKSGKAISKTFNKSGYIFTFITNSIAKEDEIQDKWRKYDNIADSRHLENNIEPAVIDSLVKSVKNYYPKISHRYYAMKKKWLKLDKLNFWDRYAPIPEEKETIISFDKAKEISLKAYSNFSPKMSEIAEKMFVNKWIDAPQYEGKASGAFSHPTVPSSHPYVLLNYAGKLRDVMTLSHETGHAIHQVLAAQHQGALMSDSSLVLSETASVFGETLTFDFLMRSISDKKEVKTLLAKKVEDSISTIIRQIALYDFELRLHKARRATGSLPTAQINAIWLETQKEALGPDFELDDTGFENSWMMIPHFINVPFYVYSYAFGNCLVNSLYEIYKENTVNQFQEKYLDILRAGNSKHHSELLRPFNINLNDTDFWDRGLHAVERMIDDIEKM